MLSNRLLTLLVPVVLTAGALASAPFAQAAAEPSAPYRIESFQLEKSDNARLARAWRTWTGRSLARYTTVVEETCFCPPQRALRTSVRGNRVISVTYQGRDRELARHGYEIEELFRLLRRAYAEAARLEVTYRAGVPVSIYIDWDERIADEEIGLNVKLA